MRPRLSICVPNLNTRPFLPERFRTIFEQSFQDWELLVYDSYSNDGAWEYICELAAREPRMRAWNGPREGTPGSWSPCVREARGEYVYVATSDDTMASDCLEKLVTALETHPECDIAHCPLRAIDESGNVRESELHWWSTESNFARSSGDLLQRRHIRRAPLDGLLHLNGKTVYISITQLLIRRSLFDRIGLFQSRWGSVGDFNWSMRAGLVANTVHVPDTWGGWRIHANQATAGAALGSDEHSLKIEAMIEDAIDATGALLDPAVRAKLNSQLAVEARRFRAFDREFLRYPRAVPRRRFILRQLLQGSGPALDHVKSRLWRNGTWQDWFPGRVRAWLEHAGGEPVLLPATPVKPRTGPPAKSSVWSTDLEGQR